MDINTKKVRKNAFRVTKVRGVAASRVRVPGGVIDATTLGIVKDIAEKYGDGQIFITNRQGFELSGIPYDKMPEVNRALQPVIDRLGINQSEPGVGYDSSGTRNIIACIGNRVCPYANYTTTDLARRVEKAIFPNDLHVKVAFTGCHNDCAKVRMHDFGVMGMTLPQFDASRCVSCQACVKRCRKKSTGALSFDHFTPVRNHEKCIGCGECVLACPTRAWTRSDKRYYRLTLFGRTGKKNPRLGQNFIKWVDEDSIVKIIENTYVYAKKYIDPEAPAGKEHIGYIVDRTGFDEYLKWALSGVTLPDQAEINRRLYWSGIHYGTDQD